MSNDYLQYVMSETWSYQKHEVLWLFDESNRFRNEYFTCNPSEMIFF